MRFQIKVRLETSGLVVTAYSCSRCKAALLAGDTLGFADSFEDRGEVCWADTAELRRRRELARASQGRAPPSQKRKRD